VELSQIARGDNSPGWWARFFTHPALCSRKGHHPHSAPGRASSRLRHARLNGFPRFSQRPGIERSRCQVGAPPRNQQSNQGKEVGGAHQTALTIGTLRGARAPNI